MRTKFPLLSAVTLVMLASCIREDLTAPTEPLDGTEISSAMPDSTHVVSYDDALSTLLSALGEIDTPETRGGAGPRKVGGHFTVGQPVGATLTRSEDGPNPDPYMHVFNFEGDEGFAMLSGDDRTPPIFMITDEGSLSTEAEIEHEGIAIFLQGAEQTYYDSIEEYEQELAELQQNEADSLANAGKTRSPQLAVVGNLYNIIYSKWSYSQPYSGAKSHNNWGQQTSPYNDYLPKKGSQSPNAGCTAAAVAMTMAFYAHPTSYNRFTYNWNVIKHYNMRKISPYAELYKNSAAIQISSLYQQLNLSQNLAPEYYGYGGDGTPIRLENVPRTFKNFGYSKGGTISAYDHDNVVSELLAGGAVIVAGASKRYVTTQKFLGITIYKNTQYGGAHSWLISEIWPRARTKTTYRSNRVYCTELEWQNLLYCNWGRSGTKNGYFLSNGFAMNNGSIKTRAKTTEEGEIENFQFELKTITGIRK